MVCNDPASKLTPLGNLFPLSVGEACDLVLTNSVWQKQWDVTSMITLLKIIMFFLLVGALLWALKQADSSELSCREAHMAQNWGQA